MRTTVADIDAHADAEVVTRAMQASTIVEIFIDEEQVLVEIEIGSTDVAAFANVLPDELYEKVTGEYEDCGRPICRGFALVTSGANARRRMQVAPTRAIL